MDTINSPGQQNSMAVKDKTGATEHRKGAEHLSETVEKKLLHEFLLLLLTLAAIGEAFTLPDSKTAWQ